MTTVCHRPEGLDQLEAQTNFTKQELQILYRGFKNVSSDFSSRKQNPCDLGGVMQQSCVFAQECPSGVVNEETFKHIYAQFFPHGGRFYFLCNFLLNDLFVNRLIAVVADASTYAHYLFNAFDTTNNGSIKFKVNKDKDRIS